MRASRVSSAWVWILLACGALALAWVPTDWRDHATARTKTFDLSRAESRLSQEAGREGPDPFDNPGEAAAFFEAQRRPLDGGEIPIEALQDALADIRARLHANASRAGAGPGGIQGWEWLGPGNIGGRTRTLVIDPTNPSTMYAGGVTGGIWKSTDAGASWTSLDDTMISMSVCTIVMDPTDPSVLYAGTGEGFFASGTTHRGFGIFKTTDAGATWTQLPDTANSMFRYVNKLAISPNDHNRLYAATRSGVWRSLDAGQTWSIRLANPNVAVGPALTNGCTVGCTDLVVRNDRDPDVIFAAFGSFQRDGLYRSDDGGDSWLAYTTGTTQGRMSLAFAPSDNDVMYILMAGNGNGIPVGQLVQLFRSADGGQTFTAQVDMGTEFGPWLLSNIVTATGCIDYPVYSQGWYDNMLAVDPVDPDTVWVGGIDLLRSDDAGVNFGLASYWFAEDGSQNYVHADVHGGFFHPDYDGVTNSTLYISNDGGLFRTEDALAATSLEDCPDELTPPSALPAIQWQTLNHNYGVTQFYHGDSSPTTDFFAGGAQDNGTSGVSAVGTPNAWAALYGGDGGYVAIDSTDPDTFYVEIQFFPEMQKTTDGGQTFTDATNGITDTDGLFITPFAMDPNDPQVLWTGGRRPWRTNNGAAAWSLTKPTQFPSGGQISAIAIAPSNSNVVYMGLNNGRVVRSTNALSANPSWVEYGSSSGLIDGAWVSSVAVHPTDPDTVYCTYSNYGIPHVYRSTNGGTTWTPIDGAAPDSIPDIPAHWVAIRPSEPDRLYLATELGVFASDDAGTTWVPTGLGIPNTIVESLDFQNDDTLIAFTHGRGAWRASLFVPPTCTADLNGDGATNVLDFSVFASHFGTSVPPGTNGDFNGSGFVDVLDFSVFLVDFGCPLS